MSKLMASPLVERLLGESFDHKSSGLAALLICISLVKFTPQQTTSKP